MQVSNLSPAGREPFTASCTYLLNAVIQLTMCAWGGSCRLKRRASTSTQWSCADFIIRTTAWVCTVERSVNSACFGATHHKHAPEIWISRCPGRILPHFLFFFNILSLFVLLQFWNLSADETVLFEIITKKKKVVVVTKRFSQLNYGFNTVPMATTQHCQLYYYYKHDDKRCCGTPSTAGEAPVIRACTVYIPL